MSKAFSLKDRAKKTHKGYLRSMQYDELIGIESYLQEIDTLLTREDIRGDGNKLENLPILITGDPYSGKSSLIAKWITQHKSSHKTDNDYFIIRFSRNTPNDTSYISLVYSIYNQIRENYQLLQRVDVIEDKLRINFKWWLELADSRQQSSQIFRKYIIIVIDSIDKLKEANGKEELPEWLPSDIPDNIRFIISCNKNSRCYNFLVNKITNYVNIQPFDQEKKLKMLDQQFRKLPINDQGQIDIERMRNLIISSDSCESPLFLKMMLHFCLLNHSRFPNMPLSNVENCRTPEDIFESAIDFYSNNGFHQNLIMKVLGYMSVTRCGLLMEEIIKVCSHSESVLNVFEVFSICFYSSDQLWTFKNDLYAKVIQIKIQPKITKVHLDVIEALNSAKVNVRTVHEKIFHYKEIKDWMMLKDYLCLLEVFFIMYTPQYRLELFRCWSLLKDHHFDPVQEYNKTLEQFVEQHNPKNPDIFIILVQLCRFFKEFSELEGGSCEFRHPPLKRLHELKDLNIYDEVRLLEGVVNKEQVNPLRKDESFAVENKKSRNLLRETILNSQYSDDDEKSRKFRSASLVKSIVKKIPKKSEMYYYKRWLWIQFPWCALDVYSDFSQIMNVFSAADMNFQHDNEMAISTLRIIREAKLKASRRPIAQKQTLNSTVSESQERSVTAFVKASGILYETLPPLNSTINLNPITEKTLPRQLSRGITTDNLNKRSRPEYNFDLMFKELTPANVLLKVGAKVADYSNHEILKKKKENNELQTNYNRLVNEARMKNLQLESIKSQIAKSEDKMKESKEFAAKIDDMKAKMDGLYEKINKAEVESKRLEQVISCCFKNSAKNELWEKGLEKGIQNISDVIEMETLELTQYQEEEAVLSEQIQEFELWFQDKIKIQENTLDRVIEQFSFKSSIKETILNGKNKRENLISVQAPPKSENYFSSKLKERQNVLKKIQKLKEMLETKIQSFEQIIQRFQNVASIEGPQDLTSIIWQLERNEELFQNRFKLDDKLKELKIQKDTLEVKLNFLKQKEVKSMYSEVSPEIMVQNIVENEKKIAYFSDACKKQELSYYACDGIIQHILNLLGIGEKKLSMKNHREVLKMIGDKLISLKNQQSRTFYHSHTLKVNTLQVPYSSKFTVEERLTPMAPSALINNATNSPLVSPANSASRKRLLL